MRSAFKGLVVLSAAALLSGSAAGADIPNINKRGSNEKELKSFVTAMAQTIVAEARSSVTAKDVILDESKIKEVKEGHMELRMSATYKGSLTKTTYTADIVVHLDTSTKDKWEVLRIEYKDDNNNPVGYSKKGVEALVNKFNAVK